MYDLSQPTHHGSRGYTNKEYLGLATGRGFSEPVGAPPRNGENFPAPLGNGTGAGRNPLPGAGAGAGENSSPSPFPRQGKFSVFFSVFRPAVSYKITNLSFIC